MVRPGLVPGFFFGPRCRRICGSRSVETCTPRTWTPDLRFDLSPLKTFVSSLPIATKPLFVKAFLRNAWSLARRGLPAPASTLPLCNMPLKSPPSRPFCAQIGLIPGTAWVSSQPRRGLPGRDLAQASNGKPVRGPSPRGKGTSGLGFDRSCRGTKPRPPKGLETLEVIQ
jgi:hypothetical protein